MRTHTHTHTHTQVHKHKHTHKPAYTFNSLTGILTLKDAEACVKGDMQQGGVWYLLEGREYVWTVNVWDDKEHCLTHDVCVKCTCPSPVHLHGPGDGLAVHCAKSENTARHMSKKAGSVLLCLADALPHNGAIGRLPVSLSCPLLSIEWCHSSR